MIDIQQRCETLVIALVGKDLAQQWWESPNWAFCLHTPIRQFRLDPQVVYKYLMKSADE